MPSSKAFKVSNVIAKSLEEAREIPKPEINDIDLIVYSTNSYPPAHILYASLLHSGKRTILTSSAEASIHILPYRENIGKIIAFVYDRKDPSIINLAQVSSLLNIDLRIYGPKLHPAYEEKLENLNVKKINVELDAPLITLSLASLLWTWKMLPARRSERIKNEIDEMESSPQWLEERYGSEIDTIKDIGKLNYVLYTFSTKPGAEYFRLLLKEIKNTPPKPLELEKISEIEEESKIITYISTVEEHFYPNIRLEAQIKRLNQIIIRFNTDPLTTGIYSMIFSSLISEGKIL